MVKEFDVVISGCGPAGSAAGYVLASKGYSVALLDRDEFPRKKLCGGLLTWKSMQALEKIFSMSKHDMEKQGLINYVSHGYSIFYSNSATLLKGDADYPFHYINRDTFDMALLEKAKKAGAKIVTRSKVVHCDAEKGELRTESGDIYRGKFIIGADGVNSLVRGTLNIDKKAWKKNLASAIEITVSRKESPVQVDHAHLYVGFIKAGYCWVFPNKDEIILGICGLNQANANINKLFRIFLDYLGFDNPDGVQLHGHPLPYGNHIKNPCKKKVLLAGDAGGFVEPLFGEGIFYALTTGRYAAEAIVSEFEKDQTACNNYISRLKKFISPELGYSNLLRWFLLTILKSLGHIPLRIFVNVRTKKLSEMVHGIRSYRMLLKKFWD